MWDKAGGGLSAGACFIPVVDLSPSWPWRAENSASLPAGVCARCPAVLTPPSLKWAERRWMGALSCWGALSRWRALPRRSEPKAHSGSSEPASRGRSVWPPGNVCSGTRSLGRGFICWP